MCADFLAGRTEESAQEEILLLIHRLVGLLPPDYQAGIAARSPDNEQAPAARC